MSIANLPPNDFVAEMPLPSSVSGTLADLLHELGDVPLSRIRRYPYPGTATVQDVERIQAEEKRYFELVDGVLVEKAMGYRESILATVFIWHFQNYSRSHSRGLVAGADGLLQLIPKLVRGPDAAFTFRANVEGGKIPSAPVPLLVPDVVVEVLSPSNTRREMERKLGEYLSAGVRLIWYVDPEERVVDVYAGLPTAHRLTAADTLDGGDVLPGFTLNLAELFAELD
jgi:Uma2 family endonuclease